MYTMTKPLLSGKPPDAKTDGWKSCPSQVNDVNESQGKEKGTVRGWVAVGNMMQTTGSNRHGIKDFVYYRLKQLPTLTDASTHCAR